MKIQTLLAGLAAATLVAGNAGAAAIDSSTLANQYDGNQIHDGASATAPWALAGGIEDDDVAVNGSNLVITPLSGADADDNNGWIQQDGGATPWEVGTVDQAQWTLEMSVQLVDADIGVNDNIVMWAEGGGNRQIFVITADSVTTLGGAVIASGLNNTDAQHVFQLQFDSSDTTADATGTYQLYRDGVLIGADLARESGQGNTRLIIGDCCTSLGNPIDQYEIGHVRFGDEVPEPGSLALLGLGGLALLRRRRA